MSISRARRKPRRKLRSLVYLMIANTYGLRRRYGRRFYRKLLKRRYIRSVVLKTWSTKVWAYTNVWRRPLQCHISYKAFFHIRIFFNISEFLLYDFYNFHRSVLSRNLGVERRKLKFFLKKPWKKINFFFYIRNSINTFRTHTLQFFKMKFEDDRRVTVFLKSFMGVHPLTYIWFFEYSLPYFLVKARFAESLGQAMVFLQRDCVFVNGTTGFDRWDFVRPADCIQMAFNVFFLMRTKLIVLKFLRFFKKMRRFFKKTILRARKYRRELPRMTNKSVHMVNSKNLHPRMFESDYKSLSVALVPYKNPLIYYSALTLFWLNFWNYRVSIWKYDIILRKALAKLIKTYITLFSYTTSIWVSILLISFTVLTVIY